MVYMVEMALLVPERRADWDAWYVAHQHRLLSIAGFRATQRFEAIHDAPSPFVALHEVASADVFTSETYRAMAGPANTGEWQSKMGNWHRNLFDLEHTPDVSMDDRLVVIDDGAEAPVEPTWTAAVGLDRSVTRRGLAVVGATRGSEIAGRRGVRVLRPLAPRLARR
jgi:hypothetical protein